MSNWTNCKIKLSNKKKKEKKNYCTLRIDNLITALAFRYPL